MPTYPDDPNLPAVTTTTPVNPAFLNTLVDNINAIGADLRILSDNAGNIDLAIDKGIAWATTLEIYKSGGDLVIDDNVGITGNLDVTGAITGTFSVSGGLDIPGTLTVDTINDSGAAQITINETIEMGAGKGLQGTGASALAINAGCNIAGNLDVSGTLTVDTINDSGAAVITVNEDMEFAAGKYVDAPTGKFDVIDDSGSGTVQIVEDVQIYRPAGTIGIYVQEGAGNWTYINSEGFIEFTEVGGAPANPGQDGLRMWVDAGDFKCKLRQGGVTVTKTLMPYAPAAYTVTNDLTDRAYDANTVAIAELADVVGTIIADLQILGLLG